ncbi:MAG: hypothetical protein V4726_11155 [Verrucomicrobiota bacterium]
MNPFTMHLVRDFIPPTHLEALVQPLALAGEPVLLPVPPFRPGRSFAAGLPGAAMPPAPAWAVTFYFRTGTHIGEGRGSLGVPVPLAECHEPLNQIPDIESRWEDFIDWAWHPGGPVLFVFREPRRAAQLQRLN